MSGYPKTIATDVISQLATAQTAGDFDVDFTATFKCEYVMNLETEIQDATREVAVIFVPIEINHDRPGWGAIHSTVNLGMFVQVAVDDSQSATEMDPLETLIDDLALFLMGPRKFATYWECIGVKPIYGDHYNARLNNQGVFRVPCICQFQQNVRVTT